MIDRSEYGIGCLAMLSAWYASTKMALWLTLHPWAKTAGQTLFTLALGLGLVTVQHFWRRYLKQRWPEDGPAQDLSPTERKALSVARVLLSNLARRGVSRLKARLQRKQS
jgi:hypothetical protein